MLENLSSYIKGSSKILQSSIYLNRCKICENLLVARYEDLICNDCFRQITYLRGPFCQTCGLPLNFQQEYCGDCLLNPPEYIRKHRSCFAYRGPVKELILKYKYQGIESLKKVLNSLLLDFYRHEINDTFDYMITVPSNSTLKRSFNHTLVLGKVVAKTLKIPLLQNLLIKVKKTPPQAGLSRVMRLKNLNGAFKLKGEGKAVKGKKILLLDDVYTTGTTIAKCSEVLFRADAEVVAITMARTL